MRATDLAESLRVVRVEGVRRQLVAAKLRPLKALVEALTVFDCDNDRQPIVDFLADRVAAEFPEES